MGNLVEVQVAEHRKTTATTRSAQIAELLTSTSVPGRRARALLRHASPLWLMSEPPAVLAADLALCHPRLKRREVRAVARPIDDSDAVRLTLVAHDRPGLLADSAAVLAGHGLSVVEGSAGTWPGLALHAFTLEPHGPIDGETWTGLGRDLETMGGAARLGVRVHAAGRATVEVDGDVVGRSLVRCDRQGSDRAALGHLPVVRRPRRQHRVGARRHRAGRRVRHLWSSTATAMPTSSPPT